MKNRYEKIFKEEKLKESLAIVTIEIKKGWIDSPQQAIISALLPTLAAKVVSVNSDDREFTVEISKNYEAMLIKCLDIIDGITYRK